jgi:hypothetical protein
MTLWIKKPEAKKKKPTGWSKKPALAPRPILEVVGGAPT